MKCYTTQTIQLINVGLTQTLPNPLKMSSQSASHSTKRYEVTQNPLQNIPITATTGSVLWILYSHNHHACSFTRHFILVSYLSREDNNILEGMYVCTYRTNYYKFPQCTQWTEIILMGGTLPRISHPIGSYKSSKGDTINTGPGPRTGDPRTRGPEDRGPKDPDS